MEKLLDATCYHQDWQGLTLIKRPTDRRGDKEENSSYGGGHLKRRIKKRLRYLPTILAVCCAGRKD